MSPTLRGALLATIALALVGSLVASADLVEGYPLPAGQALRYSLAALVLAASRASACRASRCARPWGSPPCRPPAWCSSTCS